VTKRDNAFALQDLFIHDLLNAVGPEGRRRIIGRAGA